MRIRSLLLPLLLTLLGATVAHAAPLSPVLQLDQEVALARTLRTLNLRADQVEALEPLLAQAQEVFKQRDAVLAEAWKTGQEGIVAVNSAWETGAAVPADAKAKADATAKLHDQTMNETDQAVRVLVAQFLKLLNRSQVALIETAKERELREESQSRYHGAPSLADYLAGELLLLRRLTPDEFATVRVAVCMRLAMEVLAVDAPLYPQVVNELLAGADNLRRLPDAQVPAMQAKLPGDIAELLRLPAPGTAAAKVTLGDLIDLMSNPRSAEVLAAYVPPQPAENNAGGGGQ